jgi:hypothetical protein
VLLKITQLLCQLVAHQLALALEVDAGHYLCVVVLELCCYSSANGTSHAQPHGGKLKLVLLRRLNTAQRLCW